MLQSLHVKNLALIDEAEVIFSPGLNILTGETGAGKSLLLGSINLALGGKVSKDMIREDKNYALVELSFFIQDEKKREKLKQMDVFLEEDGQLFISRRIMNGRSTSKVNGETVSAAQLHQITELLLDIYGQHEHQSLLYRSKHLEILDEFAGKELLLKKQKLIEVFEEYKRTVEKTKEFQLDEEQRVKECAFLKFEIEEIENAQLKQGEEEELTAWYKKAIHSRKILETISRIHEEIGSGASEGAGEKIGRAVKDIAAIVEYDEELNSIQGQLENIDELLSDVCRETASYLSSLEFDEGEFSEKESRLDVIRALEGKYGSSIEKIFAYQKEKIERLSLLENYQIHKERAEADEREKKQMVLKICEEVSFIRKKAAKGLIKRITDGLKDLNFLEVKFDIFFEKMENPTRNGYDEIEFMISTNPGSPLRPLGKVASGGELSRIMLAIKTVLSEKDGVETLIFDEIDTGISGRTAQKVSEKLSEIARKRQVLCITHLAQIAAMADSHYVIKKSVTKNKTVTEIQTLSQEEMIEELARILGGAEITETIRNSAKEMKDLAKKMQKKDSSSS